MTEEKATASKSTEKVTAEKPAAETAATTRPEKPTRAREATTKDEHGPEADLEPRDETEKPAEQAGEKVGEPTLTEVQPDGGVSEVVTGTPERPESTRIVVGDETPVSARDIDPRPAEFRDESQVAPAHIEGEQGLHGNADY